MLADGEKWLLVEIVHLHYNKIKNRSIEGCSRLKSPDHYVKAQSIRVTDVLITLQFYQHVFLYRFKNMLQKETPIRSCLQT